MGCNFDSIKATLEYIDNHLDEPLNLETVAKRFHFSPYYFHRMFSAIVGKAMSTEYIGNRRLTLAGMELLSGNAKSLILP